MVKTEDYDICKNCEEEFDYIDLIDVMHGLLCKYCFSDIYG